MKISTIKANEKSAEQGQWVKTELGDLEVRVGGMKTLAFRRRFDILLTRPSTAKMIRAGGKKETDARDAAFIESVLDTVLFDWKNLTEDSGTPIPYSKDYARQLMQESTNFRDAVVAAANEVDRAALDQDEDAEGNSSSVSSGTSTGGKG